nr:hypothetical protein [Photobacterium angustum]
MKSLATMLMSLGLLPVIASAESTIPEEKKNKIYPRATGKN